MRRIRHKSEAGVVSNGPAVYLGNELCLLSAGDRRMSWIDVVDSRVGAAGVALLRDDHDAIQYASETSKSG